MSGSTILKLADPYDYQAALGRAADLKTLVTASGSYQSELTVVNLHHVGLQHARISLARIVYDAIKKGMCAFSFPTLDNKAHVTFNGIEVPQLYIGFFCPGPEYVASMNTAEGCGGIFLPSEDLAIASQALVGYEITAPTVTQIIRAPSPMVRLQNLHEAATRLAATVPDVQRFHQVIEANQYEPLYISEVCASIGVAERTPLYVCSEYLGMSRHRYLWLRRMNLVR